jgi:hypothetical protein
MREYLVELSDWIMTLDLGSNHLKGNYTPASAPTHIFIVSDGGSATTVQHARKFRQLPLI